ncbi:uncharacterized protein LOC116345013 [Contarinia nasturtii]|uniref:uncharacterized protein LOC116345013 n=1 Tax=Contarinia nasturtii TaxID=265458 RepID=UPI0012D3ED65|nr:uncharacterized protein LOC116345013 [Contarinia nasturtii]
MLSRSMNATSRLKKRERTQNWAFEEKRYLLELCKRDMNIIENKRLDADLTALKNRAWKSVHEEFCKVFGNERNCNRLKEQWRRMKACTRSEILDYTNRVSKYGQEVADKKRPNAFTFEIWDFMQNAKRNSCKNDPVQTIDGSTTNQMSTDDNVSQVNVNGTETHETQVLSDDDDDELFNWQKTTQNLCEVEIKDESSSTNVGGSGGAINFETQGTNDNNADRPSTKKLKPNKTSVSDDSFSPFTNPITTSFDVLNFLRNSSFSTNNSIGNKYTDEIQLIIEMQAKEHALRMDILRAQLETAKLNRDIAEINKIILLRNLQNAHE